MVLTVSSWHECLHCELVETLKLFNIYNKVVTRCHEPVLTRRLVRVRLNKIKNRFIE